MAKKKLGIDALFQSTVPKATPAKETSTRAATVRVRPDSLRPNPRQPRQFFGSTSLNELTESIREHGVLQPLLVRPTTDDGIYEIVAGERRWRAARSAGLETVPVHVLDIQESDVLSVAMVENLQREDLNPIDEAEGYLELLRSRLESEPAFQPYVDEQHPHQGVIRLLRALNNRAAGNTKDNVVLSLEPVVSEVFDRVGKLNWRSFVTHRLPLLSLPDDVRNAVQSGSITYSKARLIARVTDDALEKRAGQASEVRGDLLSRTINENLSVRQLRSEIGTILDRAAPVSSEGNETDDSKQIEIERLLARLHETLSTFDPNRYSPSDRSAIQLRVRELLDLL